MSDDDDRGEYELLDAIDLLIQSGRTIDAIRLDGWRSREPCERDLGCPSPGGSTWATPRTAIAPRSDWTSWPKRATARRRKQSSTDEATPPCEAFV